MKTMTITKSRFAEEDGEVDNNFEIDVPQEY
jgi:hypothetical protein